MIYLIDNKKERQINFHWKENLFKKYQDVLKPFHSYNQIIEYGQETIFKENNIILFHDSFFSDQKNKDYSGKQIEIFERLNNRAQKRMNKIVFFSGSIKPTQFQEFKASLSVSKFYENLENFVQAYKSDKSNVDLRILAFGKNIEVEENLSAIQEIWNDLYNKSYLDDFFITELPSVDDDIIEYFNLKRDKRYSTIELKARLKN